MKKKKLLSSTKLFVTNTTSSIFNKSKNLGKNLIGNIFENIGIADVFDNKINMKGIEFALMSETPKMVIRQQLFKKQKRYDIIQLFSAIGGSVLASVEAWLYYNETMKTNEFGRYQTADLESPALMTIRVICSILAFTAIYATIMRYKIHLQLMKIDGKLKYNVGFRKSGLIPTLVFECLQLIIHTPPGTNFIIKLTQQNHSLEYSFDILVSVFTLTRYYLIYKVYALYSRWNTPFVNKKCHEFYAEGGINFALKAELATKPYFVIGFSLIIAIGVFGYGIAILERPFIHVSGLGWDYIWNGFWCIIVVITTVGYGDYYTRTYIGRFVLSICMIIGTFLISLAVMALINSSRFSKPEEIAYDNLKKIKSRIQLFSLASFVISSSFNYWMILRGRYPSSIKPQHIYSYKKKLYENFRHNMTIFALNRRSFLADQSSFSMDSICDKANAKINLQLNLLKLFSRRIACTKILVNEIERGNKELIVCIDDLHLKSSKTFTFCVESVKKLLPYTGELQKNFEIVLREPVVYQYEYINEENGSSHEVSPRLSMVRRQGNRKGRSFIKKYKSKKSIQDPDQFKLSPLINEDLDIETYLISQKALKMAFTNIILKKKDKKKNQGNMKQNAFTYYNQQHEKIKMEKLETEQKNKLPAPQITLVSPVNEFNAIPKINNSWMDKTISLNPMSKNVDNILKSRQIQNLDEQFSASTRANLLETDELRSERQKILDKMLNRNIREIEAQEPVDSSRNSSAMEESAFTKLNKFVQNLQKKEDEYQYDNKKNSPLKSKVSYSLLTGQFAKKNNKF